MFKNYFIILTFFLISCKEDSKNIVAQIDTVVTSGKVKIITLDSVYFSTFEKEIQSFYRSNKFQTYWLNSKNKENLIRILTNIEEEGLNSKDFELEKIIKNEKKYSELTDTELATYDVLLTKNLLNYCKLSTTGKLNPKKLYDDWELKENNINFEELLLSIQKTDSFDIAIQKFTPNHIVYKKLKTALKLLNTYPDEAFKKIEILDKIVFKDTNAKLIEIKNRLIYWKDLSKKDTITSIYDEETLKAVKHFQMRHGLAIDGVIGKSTITALNYSKLRRKKQIIANMERWRWYPRNFESNYLIINLPNYVLHVVKEKDTIQTYNVVVGTNKRKTPILSSKLSYLVLNPTWTVPPTILKEDLIPSATRSRSYFAKKNITIYNRNGSVVSPSNWDPSKGKSYRYIQSPGTINSLGMLKIIFPNRFTVYLHDTNHRDYFSRSNRSLSSGCVRVERPLELAYYILNDSIQYSVENLKGFVTDCNTKKVNIKENIYIHQLYWTAWSNNNELYFLEDIYNLDEKLYEKLRN